MLSPFSFSFSVQLWSPHQACMKALLSSVFLVAGSPFHHFNILCHRLLASSCYWKARWQLYGNFLPCGFFLAPVFFKFPIFITVCLGVELFELIVFGTFWISCLFPISGERSFWLLGLQICSLPLSLFLFHLRHLCVNVCILDVVAKWLNCPLIFIYFFFSFQLQWFPLFCLQVCKSVPWYHLVCCWFLLVYFSFYLLCSSSLFVLYIFSRVKNV